MTDYRVSLDVYHGPLDLLLFLIRREEVDIYDIPIARVTEQYVAYVELLRKIDPDSIGEFLVLAATLMELKSRMLLPRPPIEDMEEDLSDPRLELVRQLLEYKKFKDAARSLEESAAEQALRHPRHPALPPDDPNAVELENLQVWDLFEAFNRLLEQTGKRLAIHEVTVDDTPLALHAEDIADALDHADGILQFEKIFTGRTRAEMIGLFLALLELIRQQRVRVSQDDPFGPILLHLIDGAPHDEPFEEEATVDEVAEPIDQPIDETESSHETQ